MPNLLFPAVSFELVLQFFGTFIIATRGEDVMAICYEVMVCGVCGAAKPN